jgi:hypothetical protein
MKVHRRHLGRIIAVLALAVMPRLGPARSSHAADGWQASDQAKYDNAVTTLKGTIAAHLGRPLGRRVVVILNPREKPVREDGKLVDVYAGTTLRIKELDCAISVNPSMRELQGRDWSVVMAHEVFHCFQFDIDSSESKWIIEGQAEWVGQVVAGPAPAIIAPYWNKYLEHPEIPLFKRQYAAIGFYAHLDESCISPWKIFDAMLRASKAGDRSAYDAATSHCVSGSAEPFLDSWASGLFRDASHGHEWDTTGPGIPGPSVVQPAPHQIVLSNGQAASPVAAAPFTNGIYTLASSADIVQVETAGHARLSDGNLDQVLQGQADFCTRSGGCNCPPGSAYQGPPLTPLAAHADLALTGGPEGTKVTLTGRSLDDLCSKKPTPLPRGQGGTLPLDLCTLLRRGDVLPYLGPGGPAALKVNQAPGTRYLCHYSMQYTTLKTDNFVLGTAFRTADLLASGDWKPFPGFGDQSYLHSRISDDGDLAEILVRRGSTWLVVSVEYDYPSADAFASSGRSALVTCKALTRKVLSRW